LGKKEKQKRSGHSEVKERKKESYLKKIKKIYGKAGIRTQYTCIKENVIIVSEKLRNICKIHMFQQHSVSINDNIDGIILKRAGDDKRPSKWLSRKETITST